MNPNIRFPPPPPNLKLARVAPGARVAIKPADVSAPPTGVFFAPAQPAPRDARAPDAMLEEAWRKLHRASELLASEQAQLHAQQLALEAREADLMRREETVARREAEVAAREKLAAAAKPPAPPTPAPAPEEEPRSAVSRLTRAPMEIARSILGGKP